MPRKISTFDRCGKYTMASNLQITCTSVLFDHRQSKIEFYSMSVALNVSTDNVLQWHHMLLPQYSEWTVLSTIRSSPFSKGKNAENSPWKMFPLKSSRFSRQQSLTYNSTIFCSLVVSRVGGEGGGGPVLMRYPWGYPDIGKDVTREPFVSRPGQVVIRSAVLWLDNISQKLFAHLLPRIWLRFFHHLT